jgi:hypothetical protein
MKMKKYNVIFAGCCRNVEDYIKNILLYIDVCGKKFNSYKVIVYENDSHDNTRNLLLEMKKDNYIYLLEDNVEGSRTERLSTGRNKIVDTIREINKMNYYQYMIMIDMDNVNINATVVDTIDTCFKHDDWDVMTANQYGEYYDICESLNCFLDI